MARNDKHNNMTHETKLPTGNKMIEHAKHYQN